MDFFFGTILPLQPIGHWHIIVGNPVAKNEEVVRFLTLHLIPALAFLIRVRESFFSVRHSVPFRACVDRIQLHAEQKDLQNVLYGLKMSDYSFASKLTALSNR